MYQRRLLFLSLFLCSLLAGCQLLQRGQIVRGDDYQGVLFVEGQVSQLYGQEIDAWTPTAVEIAALEADLEAFLQASADPRLGEQVLPMLPTYNRQYVGLLAAGHRKVYVLFYCATPLEELEETVITVLDGGDCYFQLTYDVEERTFGELSVNGQS